MSLITTTVFDVCSGIIASLGMLAVDIYVGCAIHCVLNFNHSYESVSVNKMTYEQESVSVKI